MVEMALFLPLLLVLLMGGMDIYRLIHFRLQVGQWAEKIATAQMLLLTPPEISVKAAKITIREGRVLSTEEVVTAGDISDCGPPAFVGAEESNLSLDLYAVRVCGQMPEADLISGWLSGPIKLSASRVRSLKIP